MHISTALRTIGSPYLTFADGQICRTPLYPQLTALSLHVNLSVYFENRCNTTLPAVDTWYTCCLSTLSAIMYYHHSVKYGNRRIDAFCTHSRCLDQNQAYQAHICRIAHAFARRNIHICHRGVASCDVLLQKSNIFFSNVDTSINS